LLSGIPSVVIGFFTLLVMATVLQSVFHYQTRLNAFVAGIALGFAVIPVIFSIAEDALTSVPRAYTQAALALGASRWQTAWQIVLPAALPGVFAATVLGFGRAIGETMIVLMVCSASVMSWSIFDSARSITTTIAAEMAEAVSGGRTTAFFSCSARCSSPRRSCRTCWAISSSTGSKSSWRANDEHRHRPGIPAGKTGAAGAAAEPAFPRAEI
jgi:ABC-type phosphate transport system permease subunit